MHVTVHCSMLSDSLSTSPSYRHGSFVCLVTVGTVVGADSPSRKLLLKLLFDRREVQEFSFSSMTVQLALFKCDLYEKNS